MSLLVADTVRTGSRDVAAIRDVLAASFERQVAATPDHPAIWTPRGSVSYRDLNTLAEGIAALLRAEAPAGRAPVALMLKDTTLSIAAILGAAKACRIYIPLDLTYPEAWHAQVIEDAGAVLVLADTPTAQIAKGAAGRVKVLEIDEAGARAASGNVPAAAGRDPSEAAYILYTSGSTGRPKGVVHCHDYVVHHVDVWKDLLKIDPHDRISLLFSCGFGVGMINTFLALLNGACLYPFDVRSQGLPEFSSWLIDKEITFLNLTSSLFRTWLAAVPAGKLYPALRIIRNTSEPLYEVDILEAVKHLGPNWLITQSLGMSEAGTIAVLAIGPTTQLEPGVQPVGTLVRDMELRIENEAGGLVATGEVGEIVIRNAYLSLGYWNDPASTDAVFRADPTDPRMRLLRTGDLGRWRADGQLEYLGRKDRKIKLRGYSIELYEVEHALLRLSGVRDAVVILLDEVPGNPRLVAYVVADPGLAKQGAQAIRLSLKTQLPTYMVPSDAVLLDELPLTARGKIDRKALPRPPEPEVPQADATGELPNEDQRALIAVWKEVLKLPHVGIDDDFYELGGTSLQAFLIFSEIEARFRCDLPPTTMMKAPTIRLQSELLDDTIRANHVTSMIQFRAGSGTPLFIVHGGYGGVTFVGELARHIKSDVPVYGIQPPPLDGKHHIPRSIESIAEQYVQEIRRVQPNGPYTLGGYSFGGWVALEIAQRLTQAGETIKFLGIIDSYLDQKRYAPELVSSRVGRHMDAVRKSGLRGTLSYAGTRLQKTVADRYEIAQNRMIFVLNDIRLRRGQPTPYASRYGYYFWIYSQAARHYVPKPYQGAIAIISGLGLTARHKRFWSPIAMGGLSIEEIPAEHAEIVWPPHSERLAGIFDERLSERELAA